VGLSSEGSGLKYKIEYLQAPGAVVRYVSELDAESAWAAEVSAQIGFRWAAETHQVCCFRVMDAAGEVVAIGPTPDEAVCC
jgi:hypothetical protein